MDLIYNYWFVIHKHKYSTRGCVKKVLPPTTRENFINHRILKLHWLLSDNDTILFTIILQKFISYDDPDWDLNPSFYFWATYKTKQQ